MGLAKLWERVSETPNHLHQTDFLVSQINLEDTSLRLLERAAGLMGFVGAFGGQQIKQKNTR